MARKQKAPKKVYVVFNELEGTVEAVGATKADAKNLVEHDDHVVVTYVKEGGK